MRPRREPRAVPLSEHRFRNRPLEGDSQQGGPAHRVRALRGTKQYVVTPRLVSKKISSRATRYIRCRPSPSPTVNVYNMPACPSRARPNLGGSSRRLAPTHTRTRTRTRTHTHTRARTSARARTHAHRSQFLSSPHVRVRGKSAGHCDVFFVRNTSSQSVLSSPQVGTQSKFAGHCEDPRQQVAGALPFRLLPRHSKSHPVGLGRQHI